MVWPGTLSYSQHMPMLPCDSVNRHFLAAATKTWATLVNGLPVGRCFLYLFIPIRNKANATANDPANTPNPAAQLTLSYTSIPITLYFFFSKWKRKVTLVYGTVLDFWVIINGNVFSLPGGRWRQQRRRRRRLRSLDTTSWKMSFSLPSLLGCFRRTDRRRRFERRVYGHLHLWLICKVLWKTQVFENA